MKTKNHESYTTCKNCGHEYNFWDFGYYCPRCLAHNTATTARRWLLFALCSLLFALSTTAQPATRNPQPATFLITIKTGKTTSVFKRATTATADSLTLIYSGKTTAQLLANSPFYEHRNKTTWFYIETKKKKLTGHQARK